MPGMVKTPCGLSLVHEAEPEFLFFLGLLAPQGNGFHRDQAIDLRIAGLVDDAHGAAA